MDIGQRQRVQAIIDLMRRAKMAADENTDSANGIAVSLLHDSIEHALYLVLLDAHQTPKKREEFKDLISTVGEHYKARANKDMPFQRQLNDLNALRVAFKHRGARPSRGSTLEAFSNGTAFIEILFSDLYALTIGDFDLVDQLRVAEIRNRLVAARNSLREGNFDEAMGEIAIANLRVNQALIALFDQPRPPLSLSFSFDDRKMRDLVEYVSSGDRHTLVTSILIASGQDISAHITTGWRLPVVHALMGGTFHLEKMTPNPYTAEEVQMCLEHVTRITVWMEERFPTLEYLNGRWNTGVISPWPN